MSAGCTHVGMESQATGDKYIEYQPSERQCVRYYLSRSSSPDPG